MPFVRRNKKFPMLERAKSPILGTIPDLKLHATKIQLAVGNTIFMYADGVIEAMDESKDFFTEKRLQRVLDKISNDADTKKIFSEVNDAVKVFVGSVQQSDDIKMLALVLRG